MPSVSTIAPVGCERFFDELAEIKRSLYPGGRFQFQFSIHTTDAAARRRLIPVRTWDFAKMAAYGERLYAAGDRKITLNFALAEELPVEAEALRRYFDPQRFIIKVTPLNPTYRASQEGLHNALSACQTPTEHPVLASLLAAGYEVIVSIGELEENLIGSNCGQYLRAHLQARQPIPAG